MRIAYYRCKSCGVGCRSEGFCPQCEEKRDQWFGSGLTQDVRHHGRCAHCGIALYVGVTCRACADRMIAELRKPEPMTLERAKEVLTDRRHWDSEWGFTNNGKSLYALFGGMCRSGFEAIAIAEKYERESK